MSVNSPDIIFQLRLGLAMLSAVSIQAVRNNWGELTDQYRDGIAISDGFYAVSRKPVG